MSPRKDLTRLQDDVRRTKLRVLKLIHNRGMRQRHGWKPSEEADRRFDHALDALTAAEKALAVWCARHPEFAPPNDKEDSAI